MIERFYKNGFQACTSSAVFRQNIGTGTKKDFTRNTVEEEIKTEFIGNNAEKESVAVRQADYTDPAALDAVMQGIDNLLLISGNEIGKRIAQHRNIIDAAKKAGVKHIVYTSLLRADTSPLSVAREHPATESDLKRSGIDYTILRNGWYTENYTSSISAALENNAFYGSAGEGKISSAAREDYAEAAVAVLTSAGHEGKTYELAGDTAYTLADLAAEVFRQSGKKIPYVNISEADYAAALVQAATQIGRASCRERV